MVTNTIWVEFYNKLYEINTIFLMFFPSWAQDYCYLQVILGLDKIETKLWYFEKSRIKFWKKILNYCFDF